MFGTPESRAKMGLAQEQFQAGLDLDRQELQLDAAEADARLGIASSEADSRIALNQARTREIDAGDPGGLLPGRDGLNVQATRYGYSGDPYGDTASLGTGKFKFPTGNNNNQLVPGRSVAIKASDARALGIDKVIAEVLPEGKINALDGA